MGAVASFTLTSATAQEAAPFAIGQPFKQGDVPAGSQLVSGFADFQVTPENVWGDGSLRFAIVAGRAVLAAGVPLTVTISTGTPAAGAALGTADLKATGVTASIGAGAFGTVSWATTDWDTPFMTLVSGPKMSSWFYRKPVGADPHLVAWLEVRLWSGGEVEILPWIENGYLMVAGATNKNATYTFSLGGTQRFMAAIDLPNHCRTPLVSGSLLSHWLAADPGIIPAHDKAYLQSTKMVPTYAASVASGSTLVTGLPSTFTPLQQGSLSPAMGSGGYHPSIGLLPQWDVLYLTSSASTVWAALQRNAYSSGRYGIHFRDENTNRPIRFSQRPTLGLNGSAGAEGVTGIGSNVAGTLTAAASGTMPAAYASTHHHSMGFMAYLLTGRFYHLETLQFVATVNFLKNGDAIRNNAEGVFQSSVGANTVRGTAWALRTLAQAAAITPDADPLAAELVASFSANVAWNHGRYVAQANNPQGWIQPYNDYTPATFFNVAVTAGAATIVLPSGYVYTTDGAYDGWELEIGGEIRTITSWVGSTRTATLSAPFTVSNASAPAELRNDRIWEEAAWQQDFVTSAVGYAKSLGVKISSTIATKLTAFFAWKAQSIVGRFGSTAAGDYLFRDAAVYEVAVAPSNTANWVSGAGPWYANWGAVYAATNPTAVKTLDDGSLRGGNFPEASSYWGNLQPALAYAVEHEVSGAGTARTRMTSAPNYSLLTTSLADAPEWSIAPGAVQTTGATMPAAIQGRTTLLTDGNQWPGLTILSTTGGTGPLAQEIPAGGTDGNSPLYGWLDGTDTDYEVSWTVTTGLASAGDLHTEEDGGMDYSGAANSFYAQAWRGGVRFGTPQLITLGTAPGSTITGVNATPDSSTIAAGGTLQINTAVTGTNSFSSDVSYTILSGTGGSVNGSGLFQGPSASADRTFSIKVASVQDPNVFDIISITVSAAVVSNSILGVDASPNSSTVAAGGTVQINATVTGLGNFSTAVTRTIMSGVGGSIDSNGLFTGPRATADRTFSIKVASVQDPNQFELITIVVQAAVPVWPAVTDVLTGVSYGPTGVEYTGTAVAGGGASADAIAAAVWSYQTALNVPTYLALK